MNTKRKTTIAVSIAAALALTVAGFAFLKQTPETEPTPVAANPHLQQEEWASNAEYLLNAPMADLVCGEGLDTTFHTGFVVPEGYEVDDCTMWVVAPVTEQSFDGETQYEVIDATVAYDIAAARGWTGKVSAEIEYAGLQQQVLEAVVFANALDSVASQPEQQFSIDENGNSENGEVVTYEASDAVLIAFSTDFASETEEAKNSVPEASYKLLNDFVERSTAPLKG